MVEEARKLVKIADNIVIKIPCIPEGLKAVKILSAEGIKTNVTLVFSMAQALLAARAGASYVLSLIHISLLHRCSPYQSGRQLFYPVYLF